MSTAVEALRTAFGLQQAGHFSQSEQVCRAILAQDPAHPDALYLLGLAAQQSGRLANAIEHFGQAIAANPLQPAYHNSLGEAQQASGQVAPARTCFTRALQLDPSFALAHYNLGLLAASAGQPAAAQPHFERAAALAPGNAQVHSALGRAAMAHGKAEAGIAHFRRALACDETCAEALAGFAAAREHLETALLQSADLADAHFNLGLAHAASQDWPAAAARFQEALRLAPDSAAARHRLADALAAGGDVESALRLLAEAVRARPHDAASLVHLGRLLRTAARPQAALEAFERVLSGDPGSAAAHFGRAEALEDLERFEEAKAAYRAAIRQQPNFPAAYLGLSILCLKNTSHKHKCIFIHVPKNGGTSIKEVLDLPGGGHRSWQYYAENYPQVWQRYTTFAVIRNPWDRVVSAYHHARMKESRWHNAQLGLHPDYDLLVDKSFAECIAMLYHERARLEHESWLTQSHFVVDENSPDKRLAVDTVLRFESLDDDFAAFCRQLGIPPAALPTVNPSQRSRDYHTYYDEQTRRMVAEIYGDDIERFGYSF